MKYAKLLILFTLTTLFFGCRKAEVNPGNTDDQFVFVSSTNKNITANDLKVAEKINGIVICSIDEDILKAAIEDYYGNANMKRFFVKNFRPNNPNNSFWAMKGRVRSGSTVTRYAFELIPNELPNGDVELYLPVTGTEQHVVGPAGNTCKLRVTSGSTGFAKPNGDCECDSNYGSSTSATGTDTDGTNGLILNIIQLLLP